MRLWVLEPTDPSYSLVGKAPSSKQPRVAFAASHAPPHNPAMRSRKAVATSILKKPRNKRLAVDTIERSTTGIKSPRLHYMTAVHDLASGDHSASAASPAEEHHDSEQPAEMEF